MKCNDNSKNYIRTIAHIIYVFETFSLLSEWLLSFKSSNMCYNIDNNMCNVRHATFIFLCTITTLSSSTSDDAIGFIVVVAMQCL